MGVDFSLIPITLIIIYKKANKIEGRIVHRAQGPPRIEIPLLLYCFLAVTVSLRVTFFLFKLTIEMAVGDVAAKMLHWRDISQSDCTMVHHHGPPYQTICGKPTLIQSTKAYEVCLKALAACPDQGLQSHVVQWPTLMSLSYIHVSQRMQEHLPFQFRNKQTTTTNKKHIYIPNKNKLYQTTL